MEKGRIRIKATRRSEIGLMQLVQALLATLDAESEITTGRPAEPLADPAPLPIEQEGAA